MVLWLLLGIALFYALATVAMAGANAAAQAEIRATLRRRGVSGPGLVIMWLLASLAMASLWTVYAVQQSEWRIAAIVWLPMLAGWVARLAGNRSQP